MQWADSQVTGNSSRPLSFNSVVEQVDTATGVPEIAYFRIHLFIPAILKNAPLYQRFQNVHLFNNFHAADPKDLKNFEYLLDMSDGQGGDPPAHSLFNIATLQALLDAGSQVIDVIEKPDTDANFPLDALAPVAQILGLSNEQTYLIYMWFKYVKRDTFERRLEGGETKLGVMSQLTSQGFAQMMNIMEQEVPLIVYTQQLQAVIDTSKGCTPLYTSKFGFPQAMASSLCDGGELKIDTFTWADKEKTARAWINILFNNNTANPADYADLVFLSGLMGAELDQLMFVSTSKFQSFLMANLFKPIFVKFPKVCTLNAANTMCTSKELAYQQWLDGSILGLDQSKQSYVEAFPAYTQLKVRPELYVFMTRSGKPAFDPAPTLANCFEMMQYNRFFNLEIVGDIILGKTDVKYTTVFTNDQFASYLRYVMIEVSLGGLFQLRTPREYIEGFFDPTVYSTAQLPMWNGGDQTNDPFMAINGSPTCPLNNPIVFFTGKGDYLRTRQFGQWLGLDYITMKRLDYDSINQLSDRYVDPWANPDQNFGQVPLAGTDGFQFHPDLQESDVLEVWVNDLGRNGQFVYLNQDTD